MTQDFLNGREFSAPAYAEDDGIGKAPGTMVVAQSAQLGKERVLDILFRDDDTSEVARHMTVIRDRITVENVKDKEIDDYAWKKGSRVATETTNVVAPLATVNNAYLADALRAVLPTQLPERQKDEEGIYVYSAEQYQRALPLLEQALAAAQSEATLKKEIADQDCGPKSGLPAEVRKEVCAVESKSR